MNYSHVPEQIRPDPGKNYRVYRWAQCGLCIMDTRENTGSRCEILKVYKVTPSAIEGYFKKGELLFTLDLAYETLIKAFIIYLSCCKLVQNDTRELEGQPKPQLDIKSLCQLQDLDTGDLMLWLDRVQTILARKGFYYFPVNASGVVDLRWQERERIKAELYQEENTDAEQSLISKTQRALGNE